MSWINSRQFKITNRNGRHYVFRRDNAGNTEINIPAHIVSKGQAIAWLKAHPDKVVNPTRYRAKRAAAPILQYHMAFNPFNNTFINKKWAPAIEGLKQTSPNWAGYAPGPENMAYSAISPVWTQKQINEYEYSPSKNAWNVTCGQLKASFKTFKAIGKGRQGIVFAASRHKGIKHPFAVKIAPRDLSAKRRGEPQPVDIEYNIQSAVQKLSPNVVRVYKNMRCINFIEPVQINMPNVQDAASYNKSQQGILIMEYAAGGSLDSWLKTTKQLDDTMMLNLISDILGALFNIQKKYPDFRHNDLHMQNVFVAQRGFLIGDFGWARLRKTGTNPAVNTANGTKTASFWGVGPKTDERYDHHLFLNELLQWAQKHAPAAHPKAIEFLKRAVPVGYRGEKDAHVSEWRLKYADPCPGLPSLAKLMKDPFLGGKRNVTSPNLRAAKAKLKPVRVKRITSANLVKGKAKLKPARRIRSLDLKKAKAKLRMVARPKPKPRITGYNLRAAKAKLRKAKSPPKPAKVKSPPKKKVVVPPALFRTAKFDKMVEKIWKNAGSASGANFQNAWNNSRAKAIEILRNRLANNKPAFSPSPLKTTKAKTPPKPKVKTPSPPRALNLNYKLSPKSGRVKIKAPNSGRYVYANGASVSLDHLKKLAATFKVNIKGLRSKANIAKMIFSANTK